jgi:hypothetical protein
MRDLATKSKVLEFLQRLGREGRSSARVYLTGGSTAVLLGWRETTLDIDLRIDPELDELFRAIPQLKEKLNINVELASPSDFIPEVPGWRERSIYIDSFGSVSYYHYDPYSQALSKIERGHEKDLLDIESMRSNGLVEKNRLLKLFEMIRPNLYKYPAINEHTFVTSVEKIAANFD